MVAVSGSLIGSKLIRDRASNRSIPSEKGSSDARSDAKSDANCTRCKADRTGRMSEIAPLLYHSVGQIQKDNATTHFIQLTLEKTAFSMGPPLYGMAILNSLPTSVLISLGR